MQRADHRLTLADRFAIGAVAQAIRQPVSDDRFALGLKPERCQDVMQLALARDLSIAGGKLAADLPSGGLDLANACAAVGQRPHQPDGQLGIARGGMASGQCVRTDQPAVARAPARQPLAIASHQPGVLQTLEVRAYPVGMQAESLGQLGGRCWAAQLAE